MIVDEKKAVCFKPKREFINLFFPCNFKLRQLGVPVYCKQSADAKKRGKKKILNFVSTLFSMQLVCKTNVYIPHTHSQQWTYSITKKLLNKSASSEPN